MRAAGVARAPHAGAAELHGRAILLLLLVVVLLVSILLLLVLVLLVLVLLLLRRPQLRRKHAPVATHCIERRRRGVARAARGDGRQKGRVARQQLD